MTFANKTETNRAIDVPGFRARELTDSHFRHVMCHRKESCASAAIYHNIKLVRHHHVANDTKKGEYGNGRRCVINMKNWGTFPLNNQTLTLKPFNDCHTAFTKFELTSKVSMEANGASSFDARLGLMLVKLVPSSNVHEEISLIIILSGIFHLELCLPLSASCK